MEAGLICRWTTSKGPFERASIDVKSGRIACLTNRWGAAKRRSTSLGGPYVNANFGADKKPAMLWKPYEQDVFGNSPRRLA